MKKIRIYYAIFCIFIDFTQLKFNKTGAIKVIRDVLYNIKSNEV